MGYRKIKRKSRKKILGIVNVQPITDYISKGYSIQQRENYYNPTNYFDEVHIFARGDKEWDISEKMHVHPLNFSFKLKKMIRKRNIDVVRAYGGDLVGDIACKNKMNGIPVVVSVHDTDPELLHNSIKMADLVFCVSYAVKKLVLAKFKKTERVWLLPNRVNFHVMRPFPDNELTDLNNKYPFKFRILHVGRKTKQKNLDTVIKALKILGKDYCLLAVGMGNKKEYIKLAKEQGVIDQIYFIESIKNEELARYYSWADCTCNPSRYEGFGVIFIEALACETIVVTSDIAPMNEFIKHLENGLLVKDYENPQAIAEMIKLACNDQHIREIIKSNARKSVKKFEKGKIDTLEADYYKKILIMKQEGKFNIPFWSEMISLFKNFPWFLVRALIAMIPEKLKKNIPKQSESLLLNLL